MLCMSSSTPLIRLLPPSTERLRADGTVGCGCHEVSAWMEVSVDKCVCGEEILCLLGRLEALHLSFSPPCRSVRVLGMIVEVAALSVLDLGQQVALRHPTASQLVGDDHSRHILQTLQQTLEEPLGGFRITLNPAVGVVLPIKSPAPYWHERRSCFDSAAPAG